MGIQRSKITPEQHEQELKQLQELRAMMDDKFKGQRDYSKRAVRSADMGGHMPQKQQDQEEDGHIGASNDEVRDLLRSCGYKLGVDYVAR